MILYAQLKHWFCVRDHSDLRTVAWLPLETRGSHAGLGSVVCDRKFITVFMSWCVVCCPSMLHHSLSAGPWTLSHVVLCVTKSSLKHMYSAAGECLNRDTCSRILRNVYFSVLVLEVVVRHLPLPGMHVQSGVFARFSETSSCSGLVSAPPLVSSKNIRFDTTRWRIFGTSVVLSQFEMFIEQILIIYIFDWLASGNTIHFHPPP